MFGWGKGDQKKLDAIFTQYVRPELVDAMKSPTYNPPLNELSSVEVNYILVAVDGAPNEVGRKLGEVAKVAAECGWYVDCLFSNFGVLIDGPVPTTERAFEPRATVVQKLRQAFPIDLKSVHGHTRTPWGNYGGERRRTFGAMLPNFTSMVARLDAENYGSHVDYSAR